MQTITRRTAIRSAALAALGSRLAGAAGRKLLIGVTDWNLNQGARPEAVPLAARLGFDGVQVSFGRKMAGDKMPLDDPAILAQYLKLAKESGIAIDGTCVDRLHDNGLKSDPKAPQLVLDSIRLTKALQTKVLLLPFFGKWALETAQEKEYTADALKELAPEAAKAGVVLGLENTISAEDNVRIMERAHSPNVLVYYDVGNSTNKGFDAVKEIRWLGKDRICQIHLKDNPAYLGEGSIDFPAVVQAIRDIGFTGYCNLETDVHRGASVDADMARNLGYIRKL